MYIWNAGDAGRSMGSMINSAIEEYSIPLWGNEGETDWFNKKTYYDYYANLSTDFKEKEITNAIINVIYIVVSLSCYHVLFRNEIKKKDTENKSDEL